MMPAPVNWALRLFGVLVCSMGFGELCYALATATTQWAVRGVHDAIAGAVWVTVFYMQATTAQHLRAIDDLHRENQRRLQLLARPQGTIIVRSVPARAAQDAPGPAGGGKNGQVGPTKCHCQG